MRVLIVDDEGPARARLRRLLNRFDFLEVIGEADDGESALRQISERAADALFLDIQMPGISGLDVAASLPDPPPAVIFVTAFDRYALQAFDAGAVDYLLKPVEADRLARAVERLRERRGKSVQARPPPQRLAIANRGRIEVVAVADIIWLEAADNYVVVHTQKRALLMRRTLAGLLHDLGAAFVRTHRSAAVALAHVSAVQAHAKSDSTILMSNGATVPYSRQYRAALRACLSAER